jgi:hypothetical protein
MGIMSIYYIQIADNRKERSPLRRKCIESLKGKIRPEDTHEIIEVEFNPDPYKFIRMIDSIKLTKASSIPNLCFVDTDCFISMPLHELLLNEGIPYFGRYDFNGEESVPDIFYFYVNNRCEYFSKFLDPEKSRNPNGYSIDIKVLRELTGFEFIPDETFLHTYETMSDIVCRQKLCDMAKEYEEDRMELAMLRKNVEQMAMVMKTYENLRKANHRG